MKMSPGKVPGLKLEAAYLLRRPRMIIKVPVSRPIAPAAEVGSISGVAGVTAKANEDIPTATKIMLRIRLTRVSLLTNFPECFLEPRA